MKAELVKKTEEFIKTLLDKPVLTAEEYMILDKKLAEIKFAEADAVRKIEMAESEKRLKAMMDLVLHPEGGDSCV